MPKTKTKKVNKSQAIRDYLEKKKDAGPKEVIAALKKKGIKVTIGLVSNVKTNSQTKPKKQRKNRTSTKELGVSDLRAAAKLVKALGGAKEAKAAIDALAEFSG